MHVRMCVRTYVEVLLRVCASRYERVDGECVRVGLCSDKLVS